MAKQPSVNTFGSGFASGVKLDENFANIRESFNNTLSLDGSTPNSMEADLDMNSNDIINASSISAATLFVGGQNITSSSEAARDKLTIKQQFSYVSSLLANTATHTAGDILQVSEVSGYYKVVSSGEHLTDAGGNKLKYKPHFGVSPRAMGATDGTGTDYSTEIQLAIDVAVEEDSFLDLEGKVWRSDSTLSRNGLKVVFSAGAEIYFPPTGSYERFKEDDGTTVSASLPQLISFDVSGSTFTILGNLKLQGAELSSFTAADRKDILLNSVGIAGMTAGVGELSVWGQLYVEGFSYPIYVPDNSVSNVSTRQFARMTGTYRFRFCHTPMGYIGAAANGLDDSMLNLRIDRCGGLRSGGTHIENSWLYKSSLNMGYFFASGLNTGDAEASTVSVNGTTTLTLSAAHDDLAVGDYITVADAYERATDSQVRPLVCLVTAVSGTSVTVDALTTPNRTASGLAWYYKPPAIRVATANINAQHLYIENYWDTIRLDDNSGITAANYKLGGTRLSGRQGAPVNCVGANTSFNAEVEPTAMQSTQIDALVNYGMIRDTEDQVDLGFQANIVVRGRSNSYANVRPVQGVDPVAFFASGGRDSRFGTTIYGVNVEVGYSDKLSRLYFNASGVPIERKSEDGLGIEGSQWYGLGTKVGSANKNVDISNVAATVFEVSTTPTAAQLSSGSLYIISARNDANDLAQISLVLTDASGNVSKTSSLGGGDFTFSGVGTSNLQCVRASGTATITTSFSVLKVI